MEYRNCYKHRGSVGLLARARCTAFGPAFCIIVGQAELKLSQQPVLSEAERVVQAVQPPDY